MDTRVPKVYDAVFPHERRIGGAPGNAAAQYSAIFLLIAMGTKNNKHIQRIF
jgi:hypothetical protein